MAETPVLPGGGLACHIYGPPNIHSILQLPREIQGMASETVTVVASEFLIFLQFMSLIASL